MSHAGRLIVVEGLDGVGKTCASKALADAIGATWLRTPGCDVQEARGVVDEAWAASPNALHLFYAASVAHASAVAAGLVREGRDVVVDRYWLSTWAYAEHRGATLGLEEVERSIVAADVTLLLVADERVRRQRMMARGATAQDESTLADGVSSGLHARYRAGLQRSVAGVGLELDVTELGMEEVVAAMRAALTHVAKLQAHERHAIPSVRKAAWGATNQVAMAQRPTQSRR